MFFAKSPRHIQPDAAWRLARDIRGKAKVVAVLVDPDDADAHIVPTVATGVPTRVERATSVAKVARRTNYSVQRGETLTSIAEKFQCDTGDLAEANKIKGPRYAIRPGQRLKLSGCQE